MEPQNRNIDIIIPIGIVLNPSHFIISIDYTPNTIFIRIILRRKDKLTQNIPVLLRLKYSAKK